MKILLVFGVMDGMARVYLTNRGLSSGGRRLQVVPAVLFFGDPSHILLLDLLLLLLSVFMARLLLGSFSRGQGQSYLTPCL